MKWCACALGVLLGGDAFAGGGPWVIGQGDEQIYLGLDAQRFTRLAVGSGSYTDDVVTVDQGVNSFGAKAIMTFGLTPRIEIEAELPYVYTYTPDKGAVCDLIGLGGCETTQGLGNVVARFKGLLVDELSGAPVSFSLGLDLRLGQATERYRERITALGEGTFDLEPRFALGRIGPLPKGYWSLYLDGGFRYRFPTSSDYNGTGISVPGYEITSNLESLFTPIDAVSFGPAAGFLWRPNGVDFDPATFTGKDRVLALRILALDVGGKLIVRSSRTVTLSLSVFHTAYAINNPQDVLKVGFGVAIRDLFRKKKE